MAKYSNHRFSPLNSAIPSIESVSKKIFETSDLYRSCTCMYNLLYVVIEIRRKYMYSKTEGKRMAAGISLLPLGFEFYFMHIQCTLWFPLSGTSNIPYTYRCVSISIVIENCSFYTTGPSCSNGGKHYTLG